MIWFEFLVIWVVMIMELTIVILFNIQTYSELWAHAIFVNLYIITFVVTMKG